MRIQTILNIGMSLLLLTACQEKKRKLTGLVDPFLGTGGHGHVYPGATVPFGMVQLSPDNGDEGWDWCSGYHYSSKTIAGFSHMHLSGTGIGDWCDISVLPLSDTNQIRKEKIKIPFSHQNESAQPGYYSVKLDNGVTAELTASKRTGYHRYQFPSKEGWLRFDMGFRINWDTPTDGMLEQLDDSTIVGYRFSTGWAKGQKVFFAARTNQSIQQIQFIQDSIRTNSKAIGKEVKAVLHFNTNSVVEMRVSLSTVSTKKALEELNTEIGRNFEMLRTEADELWEKELQKIDVYHTEAYRDTLFYTALYRTCLAPVISSDRDQQYQTHNNQIKSFNLGIDKYTIFSQWDVFRALHPLFTITQTNRLPDMLNSMLQFYDDNGLLPVWDISTWEANTMTGYHTIPILADAMLKGIQGFDYNKAFDAMKKSANQNQRGTQEYIQYGYVPQDKHGWSVTMTLEYAYDDWCIAQVAKMLGKEEDYAAFMRRAAGYQLLFDSNSGFFRGKNSNGNFIEPFDPLHSEHGFEGQYIEGTAWQHSFFVPHDLEGFAKLHGGKEKLVNKLDELFSAPSVLKGENVSADVTGLIGQYAHGNEPSHHIIYMYTALGYPKKAAYWLRVVADSMYKTGPDGLIGNDDCGQMSAWYIWTSLGMYPMNPASSEYIFGYPLIESARIQLPNGKELKIEVKNKKVKNGYISKVKLNGKEIPISSIQHKQILEGGTLSFELAGT